MVEGGIGSHTGDHVFLATIIVEQVCWAWSPPCCPGMLF